MIPLRQTAPSEIMTSQIIRLVGICYYLHRPRCWLEYGPLRGVLEVIIAALLAGGGGSSSGGGLPFSLSASVYTVAWSAGSLTGRTGAVPAQPSALAPVCEGWPRGARPVQGRSDVSLGSRGPHWGPEWSDTRAAASLAWRWCAVERAKTLRLCNGRLFSISPGISLCCCHVSSRRGRDNRGKIWGVACKLPRMSYSLNPLPLEH